MIIEDKLQKTRFNADTIPHIKVNVEICKHCAEKPCLYVCPVQNYTVKDGEFDFVWQSCVECGACRIVCDRGAIEWNYPRGGFGVFLRYG